MFNIFGKKEKPVDPSLNPRNPAALFPLLGAGFEAMWGEFVREQHKAVDAFGDYVRFKDDLLKEYPNIDFNRAIHEIQTDHKPVVISAGEGMYLKALDLNKGFNIASEHYPEDVSYVDYTEYVNIVGNLTADEKVFSYKMKDYILREIRPLVEEAYEDFYGYNGCETNVPLNTPALVEYHRFLAADMTGNNYIGDKGEEWKRIWKAPLFRSFGTITVVPVGIQYLDAFILDWLCFASMAMPTSDTYKLISYKNDDGVSVKDSLIMAYGKGAYSLLIKTLTDFNCSAFRSFARQGLKLEEAKNRDDVLKAMHYLR